MFLQLLPIAVIPVILIGAIKAYLNGLKLHIAQAKKLKLTTTQSLLLSEIILTLTKNKYMDGSEKKKIGQRLTTRVSTGLSFIEFNYLNHHSTPDVAWIRNIYILLSFYSELLLKAIFVIKKDFVDVADLEVKLKRIGHSLKRVGEQIGKNELKEFGIKDIKFANNEYLIETDDGTFAVKDFNDIRYDFLDDRIRTLQGDEHEMFKKQIDIMEKINGKLKPLVW